MLTEKNKGILPKHLKRVRIVSIALIFVCFGHNVQISIFRYLFFWQAPVYLTMSSAIAGPMEDRESVRETNFVQVGSLLTTLSIRRILFTIISIDHFSG